MLEQHGILIESQANIGAAMKRFMQVLTLSLLASSIASAQPAVPGKAMHGIASYLTAFEVTGPQDYLLPAPTEKALVPGAGSSRNLALIRGFSLVGAAGGIAMTVWGLSDTAGSVVEGDDAAGLHRALALAISGTVIAAISSTIAGLAGK